MRFSRFKYRFFRRLAGFYTLFSPIFFSASAAWAQTPAVRDLSKPHELSVWSMFLNADIIVKGVMIGLIFASVATWTVLIAKTIELQRARKQADDALNRLRECRSLEDARNAIGEKDRFAALLLADALREIRLSDGALVDAGLKERLAAQFLEVERGEARKIRVGTGLLASIGSTGPFVGLFGTVWGIMNSFIGISKAQTTNLAVVAPGIAEALLATGIGLIAAIPAVLIYNHLGRAIGAYLETIARLSGEILRIVSRDLDRASIAAKFAQATK